jgi:hypothetical protein
MSVTSAIYLVVVAWSFGYAMALASHGRTDEDGSLLSTRPALLIFALWVLLIPIGVLIHLGML